MAVRTADPRAHPGMLERLWRGRLGPAGRLLRAALTPAELAFRGIVAVRNAAYDAGLSPARWPPVPTISVGNIAVGGTGKTPLVRWLVEELAGRGRSPGILHGGYADDEPALHGRWFPDRPVVADRDRIRGADTAVSAGADLLVLDDGFQHRRIRRHLDIVLVAAETWTARPRLLPAGPYREPVAALARADLVIVTRRTAGADTAATVAAAVRELSGVPTAVAYLAPGGWRTGDGAPREGVPGTAVAVAAIARPEAFFRQVEELGVELRRTLVFRDHHPYGSEAVASIRQAGRATPVVTTAKDAVKLAHQLPAVDLWVLEQTVRFEDGESTLRQRLDEAVA